MGSMWMFSMFSCLFPIILLGLIAHSIRILWITLVPPKSMSREAACGQCGYAVAGLTDTTCPECGSDWRIAGITTPALIMRYRGGTFGAIVAWSILMVGVGLFVVGIGGALFGRQYYSTVTSTPQTITTPLTPTSTAYTSVNVASTAMMIGRGGTTEVSATLSLSGGALWKLSVDPVTKSCEITDPALPNAPTATPYKPGSTAAFYKAAGLDTTDKTIAAEAAELERIVDIELMSASTQPSQMNLTYFTPGAPQYSGGMTSSSSMSGPAAWIGFAMVGGGLLWLVLYIGGIVYIVVRRGRLMGSYARQAVYSPGM